MFVFQGPSDWVQATLPPSDGRPRAGGSNPPPPLDAMKVGRRDWCKSIGSSRVPGLPVRAAALALLAIDLYAARDVVGHGDRSWCLTLAGTPFELGTPPCDGVATDGQVG